MMFKQFNKILKGLLFGFAAIVIYIYMAHEFYAKGSETII